MSYKSYISILLYIMHMKCHKLYDFFFTKTSIQLILMKNYPLFISTIFHNVLYNCTKHIFLTKIKYLHPKSQIFLTKIMYLHEMSQIVWFCAKTSIQLVLMKSFNLILKMLKKIRNSLHRMLLLVSHSNTYL